MRNFGPRLGVGEVLREGSDLRHNPLFVHLHSRLFFIHYVAPQSSSQLLAFRPNIILSKSSDLLSLSGHYGPQNTAGACMDFFFFNVVIFPANTPSRKPFSFKALRRSNQLYRICQYLAFFGKFVIGQHVINHRPDKVSQR